MPVENIFINTSSPLTEAENYPLLREAGINYLQLLSGKIWTDYNVHDPGVTILELLCYAITDLGYRTRFEMADLLTEPGKSTPDTEHNFFTALNILPTHPIIPDDYRKLLLEKVPGLKNVWLEKLDTDDYEEPTGTDTNFYRLRRDNLAIKTNKTTGKLQFTPDSDPDKKIHIHGLYRVKAELQDWETIMNDTLLKKSVEQAVNTVRKPGTTYKSLTALGVNNTRALMGRYIKQTLHEYRNLCEDFESVFVTKNEFITICADIEVKPGADINIVLQRIYKTIYNYVSPSLNFYSLEEMLDKGKTMEQIYEGTIPQKGFVDYEELTTRLARQRTTVYTSDIVNLLLDDADIISIKNFLLSSMDENGNMLHNAERYCLHLTDKVNSSFNFKRLGADGKPVNKIMFFKAGLPLKAQEPASPFPMQDVKLPKNFIADLPVPSGVNRGLDQYYPVQNEFPDCYYAGMKRIPQAQYTPLRQSQRMQLKGYLVFFEQLLANYLAQLAKLPFLFSWKNPNDVNVNMYQRLQEISFSDEPLIDFTNLENPASDYMRLLHNEVKNTDQRNRLLDSMLARFNEKFVDYGVFKFTTSGQGISLAAKKEWVSDKCNLLKNYGTISTNRSHAVNINNPKKENVSGYHRYMAAILGLNEYYQRHLCIVLRDPNTGAAVLDSQGRPFYFDIAHWKAETVFGMHVVEHVLLRPIMVNSTTSFSFLSLSCCPDDGERESSPTEECNCDDPYSMHVTVVVPGWPTCCMDMEFRKFVNHVLRLNAPAHVGVKICWVGMVQMFEFEEAYYPFLAALKKREQVFDFPDNAAEITKYNIAVSKLVDVMNNLKNVYPPALLHDCDNSQRDTSGNLVSRTVVLNRTTLGSVQPTGLNILHYSRPFPIIVNDKPVWPKQPAQLSLSRGAKAKSRKPAKKAATKKKKAVLKKAAKKTTVLKKKPAAKSIVKRTGLKKTVKKAPAKKKKVVLNKSVKKAAPVKKKAALKIAAKKTAGKKNRQKKSSKKNYKK